MSPVDSDILTACIALSMGKGVTASVARELICRFGSAQEFFARSRSEMEAAVGLRNNLFADERRRQLLDAARKECAFVEANAISAAFIDNDGYPERLARCEDAPVMLYSLGSPVLDAPYVIGVVGTRHSTSYGLEFTSALVSDLAAALPGVVIVSGLAYGIDVAAHTAALKAGTPTVGVLAHGLNTIYPAAHRSIAARMVREGGALVSEYTSSAGIHRSNFLARNRIVAGLCDCIVVVESDIKGGALSTARIAGDYSRDVFAVPGRVTDRYSRGTNRLIADNAACLIRDASDILDRMGWTSAAPSVSAENPYDALSSEQRMIIDIIRRKPEATANDICVLSGLPYNIVADRLFQLEIDDLISIRPGGSYGLSQTLIDF